MIYLNNEKVLFFMGKNMTYRVSAINNTNLTDFYKGKKLEIIQDKFSSIFTTISSIELKDSLFIELERLPDIEFDKQINAYDSNAHCLIELFKVNGNRNIQTDLFLVKKISENKDFFRSCKREPIKECVLSLCFKDIYNQTQYKELKGHDISKGGISFLIKEDEIHSINEYISISCEELMLENKEIQLMNMNRINTHFIVGTKFK